MRHVKKTPILIIIFLIVLLFFGIIFSITIIRSNKSTILSPVVKKSNAPLDVLSIEAMRQGSYPGSNFVIEQTLDDGSNYHQYIASYLSDGLKIYGLLTVPLGSQP